MFETINKLPLFYFQYYMFKSGDRIKIIKKKNSEYYQICNPPTIEKK